MSRLRRCIYSGSQTALRRLDSCAFWRQAYEKSEVAHNDLLDKHHELEQLLEQLRGDLRQSSADHAQAGLKRKRNVKQAAKKSTNCKLISADASMDGPQRPDRRSEDTDSDLSTSDNLGGCELLRESLPPR